ncbi:MAG: NAD(P)-dependent alcohol dehydrogenase [Bacteroidetes bacterium]|nr:NAD(P)-dependent alcohol dehydrogenase [Bacteroidota bacterium]
MKAVVAKKYGPPQILQIKEVEKPIPKENEVLIRVRATTVNRTDCANLMAKPFIMRFALGFFKPKNSIMGTEFAGNIIAVGKAVTTFKVADKVFGFDDTGIGSHAEYMIASEDNALTTMPENLTYEQAAASIEGAHYAYNFINKVDIQSGHKALVNGASGGIGSATVQLLKYFGADITAVCNTKNIQLVKSLGASRVIDYLKEDFTKDKEKYDFVFDSVGKSSFGKCKSLLKPGGVYMSSELGRMSQNVFFSLITKIFGKMPGQSGKQVKFPYPPNIMRSVILIKKLIEEGKFKSVIDKSYSLEQIVGAFKYVNKGQKTGNVVITVGHTNIN